MIEPTLENGYALGRPSGRDHTELAQAIIDAIDKLPMAARMYPDVYAWRIEDAVLDYFAMSEAPDTMNVQREENS